MEGWGKGGRRKENRQSRSALATLGAQRSLVRQVYRLSPYESKASLALTRDGTASNDVASELCPQKQLTTWMLYKLLKPLQTSRDWGSFVQFLVILLGRPNLGALQRMAALSCPSPAPQHRGCISAERLTWQGGTAGAS